MASTSAVFGFYMKARADPPAAVFEDTGNDKEPFRCVVALGAVRDDVDGFVAMRFDAAARSKKQAKTLAMDKAFAYLSQQPIYGRLVAPKKELQDAWSLVNELLVSLYRLKSKDVRAQICLATWHLDGWIPIAAILTNPMTQKYFKQNLPAAANDAERLVSLAADLRGARHRCPGALELSECGYKVRLAARGAEAAAEHVNPGFMALVPGSAQQAMEAIVATRAPVPERVSCVLVPADRGNPIEERSVPAQGHYRAALAAAMRCPQERLVRIATQSARCMHDDLEATLADHDHATAAAAAAADDAAACDGDRDDGAGAQRARKLRKGPQGAAVAAAALAPRDRRDSSDDDDDASDRVHKCARAGSDDGDAAVALGKRGANGVAPDAAAEGGLHASIRKLERSGDCYVAVPPEGATAPHNLRATLLLGLPVWGDLLVTRVRLAGTPRSIQHHGPRNPSGRPVVVRPLIETTWLPATWTTVLGSAVALWATNHKSALSLVHPLPRKYVKGVTWSTATPPLALLQHSLEHLPDSVATFEAPAVCSHADRAADGAADDGASADAVRWRCTGRLRVLGEEVAVGAGVGISSHQAEQQAALNALHQFADIRTRLIGDPPAAHAPARPAPAAARAPGEEDEEALDVQVTGIGQPLVPGTAVKGTFEVVFVRRGGEAVTLERTPFSGTIGHGLWPPAVEDALTHLKAASVATLRTELCVFGEDPCRHLPRTPVTIRIAVSARLQTIIDIKLFERPLAQQRFELVSQILEEEGCRSVVDFGCGEASWVRSALLNPRLEDLSEVLGVDTATSSLNRARRFIGIEMFSRMAQPDLFPERMPRANLTKGPLLEAEQWGEWAGCDAAISVEVVEHVRDTDAYAKSLLGCLRPRLAIVSTPNMEYNQVMRWAQPAPKNKGSNLPIGKDGYPMREADHKFEWSRREFRAWAHDVANRWGYGVTFMGVGTSLDEEEWRLWVGDGRTRTERLFVPDGGVNGAAPAPGEQGRVNVGHATQMAVFERLDDEPDAPLPTADLPTGPKLFDSAAVDAAAAERAAREYVDLASSVADAGEESAPPPPRSRAALRTEELLEQLRRVAVAQDYAACD